MGLFIDDIEVTLSIYHYIGCGHELGFGRQTAIAAVGRLPIPGHCGEDAALSIHLPHAPEPTVRDVDVSGIVYGNTQGYITVSKIGRCRRDVFVVFVVGLRSRHRRHHPRRTSFVDLSSRSEIEIVFPIYMNAVDLVRCFHERGDGARGIYPADSFPLGHVHVAGSVRGPVLGCDYDRFGRRAAVAGIASGHGEEDLCQTLFGHQHTGQNNQSGTPVILPHLMPP